MARLAAALVCVAISGLPVTGGARAGERVLPERTIRVAGSATVAATPDRARVSLSVRTTAPAAATAAATNARKTAAVLASVRAMVGDDGEASTAGYSLTADYEYINEGGKRSRRLIGYVAANSVRAVTADLANVGRLIDAAIEGGANEIGSLTFFLADQASASRQATLEAGRRARAEAETVAESLGVALGELIEASTVAAPPPVRPAGMRMAMEAQAAPTPIVAGNVDVTVTVSAIFAVQ